MIARVLITVSTIAALTSAALAQQPAPARDAVGTTGTAVAPAAARVADAVVVDPKDYRIGPEDVLAINVWKNAELSRERIPVRPDGKISHALINDIDVAGLTTNQIKAELTKRFSQFIDNPEVSVVVLEVHSFKVSVSGNVRMAGYFEVKTPDATVLDMLARAQGLNEFADKGSIKVIRRGQKGAIEFKYNDAINGKNDANFIVQPGDVIVVN